jgi:hypothetical protein
MSFFPDLARCRKNRQVSKNGSCTVALNYRVKRKIRTDPDLEYDEGFWPDF